MKTKCSDIYVDWCMEYGGLHVEMFMCCPSSVWTFLTQEEEEKKLFFFYNTSSVLFPVSVLLLRFFI